MKKLFEKPVMDVLFFDEEDITAVDSGVGNTKNSAFDLGSNAEIAADGLNNSVITVEKASSIIDK